MYSCLLYAEWCVLTLLASFQGNLCNSGRLAYIIAEVWEPWPVRPRTDATTPWWNLSFWSTSAVTKIYDTPVRSDWDALGQKVLYIGLKYNINEIAIFIIYKEGWLFWSIRLLVFPAKRGVLPENRWTSEKPHEIGQETFLKKVVETHEAMKINSNLNPAWLKNPTTSFCLTHLMN
mgnify:CR=1 FL=1